MQLLTGSIKTYDLNINNMKSLVDFLHLLVEGFCFSMEDKAVTVWKSL